MSSKSKSSQSTQQQDNRTVADNGAIAIAGSSGVTINQTDTDLGLIERAFSYLTDRDKLAFDQQNRVLESVGTGFEKVLKSGEVLLEKSASASESLLDKSASATNVLFREAAAAANPASQQTRFEYLLIAAVALIFLVPAFRGKS